MTLANKYRPSNFSDVVEQSLITDILSNMCKSESLSNRNFLFTGPAGTGKTTLGRIVGKTLNNGVGNLIEIDAASNSGVDAMRDIVQQAKLYPIGMKYKVFIIDEAHALSNPAWQSLLKILEESPAKSVFIFCTTNPEKIPATILSRVQTFRLSKISLSGICERLTHILDKEISEGRDITYTADAVNYVAKLANGGLRDALTLLDKVLVFTLDITSENVIKSLNLPNYDDYFKLLSAIAKKDNGVITATICDVYNSGVNFIRWFEDFHSFIINIVKYIYLKDIERTMIPSTYSDKISKYGVAHANICLVLGNKLLNLVNDMKSSNYQQELALTYLCSPEKSKGGK